jgi:acetyltransferase-like isoleucine patch superfamily enzyme
VKRLLAIARHDGAREVLVRTWGRFWVTVAAIGVVPRLASALAALVVPPYYGRHRLARLHPKGFTSADARVAHSDVRRGAHTSLGERVVIYEDRDGGSVTIGDRCTLNRDVIVQTGSGGHVRFGADTHVQPRCQFSAYLGSIDIGAGVSIAPNCAFYPYDHGTEPDRPIRRQGIVSSGDIVIEDDVWIGTGVIVLADVRVGRGAVLAAGAVVTADVPQMTIAAGVPARVIATR